MTDHTITDRLLYALYCLSRDTSQIDATELARAVGVSATRAALGLVELERAGLVDATRARLTMLGLARAVALSSTGSGGPAVELGYAKPRAKATPATLAAQPAGVVQREVAHVAPAHEPSVDPPDGFGKPTASAAQPR